MLFTQLIDSMKVKLHIQDIEQETLLIGGECCPFLDNNQGPSFRIESHKSSRKIKTAFAFDEMLLDENDTYRLISAAIAAQKAASNLRGMIADAYRMDRCEDEITTAIREGDYPTAAIMAVCCPIITQNMAEDHEIPVCEFDHIVRNSEFDEVIAEAMGISLGISRDSQLAAFTRIMISLVANTLKIQTSDEAECAKSFIRVIESIRDNKTSLCA